MLDPKGNTAVYVLYAYARIAGVLRRAEHDVSSLSSSDLVLTEPSDTWRQQRSRSPQIVEANRTFTNIGVSLKHAFFCTFCIILLAICTLIGAASLSVVVQNL